MRVCCGTMGLLGAAESTDAPTSTRLSRYWRNPRPPWRNRNSRCLGSAPGHYLCLFGMHVLTPLVMELLGEDVRQRSSSAEAGPLMLSPALDKLAKRERYLALELEGACYNIGIKYGLLIAQLALVLNGNDRER